MGTRWCRHKCPLPEPSSSILGALRGLRHLCLSKIEHGGSKDASCTPAGFRYCIKYGTASLQFAWFRRSFSGSILAEPAHQTRPAIPYCCIHCFCSSLPLSSSCRGAISRLIGKLWEELDALSLLMSTRPLLGISSADCHSMLDMIWILV